MPSWKKIIVSGSQAHLAAVTASSGILVGSNQQITTSPSTTFLSGSFSGSHIGPLTGTASWATNAITASYVTGSIFTNTNPALTASYALTASFVANPTLANNLTQGTGITAFTYNGSSAQTVAVSGANTLNTNAVTKWTGNAFANSTIIDDGTTVTIAGNLQVNGSTTTVSSSNLLVADRFILLASGSTSNTDGGVIVQNAANGTGSALYYDGNDTRWALATAVGQSDINATPNSYVVAVSGAAANPSGNPIFGASDAARIGAMYVNTSDESIWIWS